MQSQALAWFINGGKSIENCVILLFGVSHLLFTSSPGNWSVSDTAAATAWGFSPLWGACRLFRGPHESIPATTFPANVHPWATLELRGADA